MSDKKPPRKYVMSEANKAIARARNRLLAEMNRHKIPDPEDYSHPESDVRSGP